MKPEIIDLTQEPKPKPIEITHCLQFSPDENGYPFFYPATYCLGDARKITRVGTHRSNGKTFDVIVVERDSASTAFYLGYWNDGVL